MAKKSQKRPARPKKDNAGCMSGLISMFDFRQGRYTQKLLPDRKYGSGRHAGSIHSKNKFDALSNSDEEHEDINDNDPKKMVNNDGSKVSIKALMAEEMIQARTSKKISSSEAEQIRANLVGVNTDKNHKRRQSQTCKAGSNHDIDDSGASESGSSSFGIMLTELMVEFCRQSHGDRGPEAELTQKRIMLQEALKDITEDFIAQNRLDSKQPKDLMDALETLNSNKDVFLRLLQDPNSLLFKYILDLQREQTGKIQLESETNDFDGPQQAPKQTKHHFFRRKDKSNERGYQDLKRIVVLKPSPMSYEENSSIISPKYNLRNHEATERASSHFSIKEIKRRLRSIVGDSKKERDLIAMDGVLHKIPYGSSDSPKLSALLKQGDNDNKIKQAHFLKKVDKRTVGEPSLRESVFCEEARKRLADMFASDSQSGVSSPRQVSKSLGRILSLSEFNSPSPRSPRYSPGRETQGDVPVIRRSSMLQVVNKDDSSHSASSTDAESFPCSNSVDTLPEAKTEIEEVSIEAGSAVRDQESEGLDMNAECTSKKEGSPVDLDTGPFEEAPQLKPAVLVQKIEASENANESQDRPSPVSVLQPFFSDDVTSPERTESDSAELAVKPRQLTFEELGDFQPADLRACTEEEETKLMYVRSVLQASCLDLNKLSERWKFSDQLLDPFVFDEVEILYGDLIDDPKLLFDCINDFLVEIRDKYQSCSPWLSAFKTNIRPTPKSENFVREVCRGVHRHLQRVSPYTLDRVVRKDLEEETWMNVMLESEGAVFDVGEEILEYIMEETILELWD